MGIMRPFATLWVLMGPYSFLFVLMNFKDPLQSIRTHKNA